jgi:hypothetical protein
MTDMDHDTNAMALPEIPDDDRDFTPELARKIIGKYQEIIFALRANRASSMPLVSDETRPAVEIARQMLAMGINVQATGEVTNQVVAGIIKSLLDHIDELEADLKCAVAVGRYAARAPSPQGTDQPTLPMAPGADHG